MQKIISLLFVSVLFLSGSALASLEEIFPIKVTKQNQSQYNITVDVSLPTDFEGYKDEDTKNRVVNLKDPKKYNGRKLSSIHISSPCLSTNVAFDDDFKDVNAYSTFFYINVEVIKNTELFVSYTDSDNFFLIDLKTYIVKKR